MEKVGAICLYVRSRIQKCNFVIIYLKGSHWLSISEFRIVIS